MGRPRRRGARRTEPRSSATPTSRSAAARWRDPRRAARPRCLEPDLVTIHAGGNDILRPAVDLDALRRATTKRSGGWARRARHRDDVDRHGPRRVVDLRPDPRSCRHVQRAGPWDRGAARCRRLDLWPPREFRDWRLWGVDRPPSPPQGQQLMAILCWTSSGSRHDLQPMPPTVRASRPDQRRAARADLQWCASPPRPWVHRRLNGPFERRRHQPKRPDTRGRSDRLTSRVASHRRRWRPHCGCSSVGRARPSQGRCREFESRHPLRVARRNEVPTERREERSLGRAGRNSRRGRPRSSLRRRRRSKTRTRVR